MPVFQVEFDVSKLKSGARDAITVLNSVANSAQNTQDGIEGIKKTINDSISSVKSYSQAVLGLVAAYNALKPFARGVEMNAAWEQSRIGIASVIASVNTLKNAQGGILTGQDAYNASLKLAEQAMNRIKIMGLETTATTEDLVAGFQQLTGPAAAAGLSMEQTLKFTTSMVQALGAIGIPFNQLSAEARSLLDGTIVPTQDRLATTLGITGDMVRNWKEQGVLAQKLLEKMNAFAIAGSDVAKTWAGAKSNLQDALDVLAGTATSGLYDNLRNAVLDFTDALVNIDAGGASDNVNNLAEAFKSLNDSMGEGILNATHSLIDGIKFLNDNFDTAKTTAALFGGALAGLTLYKKASASESLNLLAADIQLQGVQATLIDRTLGLDSAQQKNIATQKVLNSEAVKSAQHLVDVAQAELKAAHSSQVSAQSLVVRARYQKQQAVTSRQVLNAEIAERNALVALDAAQASVFAKTNALSVAQKTLAQATTTATGSISKLAAVGSGLKNLGSSLLSAFGGPVGVAVTALTAGIAFLATRQSEAKKAAQLHSHALSVLNELTSKAAKENKKLADSLGNVSEARRNIAIDEATASIKKFAGEIKLIDFSSATAFTPQFREQAQALDDMADAVYNGEQSFSDFHQELSGFYNELRKNGEASSDLGKRIKKALDLASQGADAQAVLDALQGKTNAVADAMDGVTVAAKQAGDAINAAFDPKKLQGVLQSLDIKKLFAGFDGLKLAQAQALQQAGKNAAEISKILSGEIESLETNQILWAAAATYRAEKDKKAREEAAKTATQLAKNAESEAKRFSESVSQYDAGLKQLRNEVSSLEDSLDPSLTKFEKLRKQIEAERDAAIQNADVKAEETVRRKQATAAQAKETAELEKRKAKLTATQKLEELENQNLRDKADFYKDLAEKTGKYSTSMEYQNQLLEKQREIWISMGIPVKDVQEMISQLQLESSRDPFDGITRGLQGFITEATDGAKAMESTFSDLFNGMDSGFHDVWEQMLEDGKVSLSSFKSLFASFLADLMHMAITRPITVQIAGVVSGMLGTGGVAYAAGGNGGSGGIGLGNFPFSSLLPDSWTSGVSSFLSYELPGTAPGISGLYGPTMGGGNLASGLSLGSALMYGGLGSLGYSLLGGALGLPQNKYSGITSGLGAGLGAWGASAALSGTALGATLGSAVPVVGTVIGAALGGALSGLFGSEKKTHPSVYTNVTDQSLFDTDWKEALVAGAWTDRASVSDVDEIFDSLAEIANGTATSILDFAKALPDEYGAQVLEKLNEATVSFGRGSTAGRGDVADRDPLGSDWNFQTYSEERLQESLEAAGTDIQRVMLNALSDAVGSVDMSAMFSSLDFSSTEGLEKAMNAINSVNAITDAIDGIREPQTQAEQQAEAFVEQMNALEESVKSYGLSAQYAEQLVGEYRTAYVDSYVEALDEMFSPLSEIETQAQSYKEAIDGYVAALTTMGASEEQLAQVRGYNQQAIDTLITSLSGSLSPLSEFEQAQRDANAAVDQTIAGLRQLTASEEEIASVEAMRADIVKRATEEMLRSFDQSVSQRWATLNGTSDAVSRAIEQENELREAIEKFGEGSTQVAELLKLQVAESAQAALESATAEYDGYLSQMQSLEAQRVQLQQQAVQNEISAISEQLSAAKTLKSTWESLEKSLRQSRENLWSGTNNLDIFSRLYSTQSEFDRLYAAAMGGDSDAAGQLASVGTTLLDLKKQTAGSEVEYLDAFYDVDQRLKAAQDVAGNQLSTADRQLAKLQEQLDAQNAALAALQEQTLTLAEIDAQIAELKPILEAALAAKNAAQNAATSAGVSGGSSGGSSQKTMSQILSEKVESLNRGEFIDKNFGIGAGGWNVQNTVDAMVSQYGSVQEWYKQAGKYEGFASGGLTPRNTPFLVGEKGPELMMSPQQYGVLSNSATRQLMVMPAAGTDGGATAIIVQLRESNAELKEQNRLLHSLLLESQSTRKNTANVADSVENMVRTGVRTRQQ